MTRDELKRAIGHDGHFQVDNYHSARVRFLDVGDTYLFHVKHGTSAAIERTRIDCITRIDWEEVVKRELPLRSNL